MKSIQYHHLFFSFFNDFTVNIYRKGLATHFYNFYSPYKYSNNINQMTANVFFLVVCPVSCAYCCLCPRIVQSCLTLRNSPTFIKKKKAMSVYIKTFVYLIQMSQLRLLQIIAREYRRGNQNGQSRETANIEYTRGRKSKQKHNVICVGHHYAQTNTNNVNKTRALLQINTHYRNCKGDVILVTNYIGAEIRTTVNIRKKT